MIPTGTMLTQGQKLRVVNANATGYTDQVGKIVTVQRQVSVSGANYCLNVITESGNVYAMYTSELDFGWSNRKEHAEYLEADIKVLEKSISEKRHLAKRLAEFESDEDEIASVLISAVDGSELPKEQRMKNLARLLKGRLKTDLI